MASGKHGMLKMVAIAISAVLSVVLVFTVLFIQVRNTNAEHKRQLNYDEIERVQNNLRDWVDVLRERVDQNARFAGDAGAIDKLAPAVTEPVPVEDYISRNVNGPTNASEVEADNTPQDFSAAARTGGENETEPKIVPPPAAPDWCRQLLERSTVRSAENREIGFELAFSGTQRRDERIMLSNFAFLPKENLVCSQINMASFLDPIESRSGPSDIAIIGNDGTVLLVLRGNAPWPRSLRDPDTPKSSKDAKAKDGESVTGEENDQADAASARLPSGVEIAGQTRKLFSMPFDMGRTIMVGRLQDKLTACVPRQCSIVALDQPTTLSESVSQMTPVTRTTFLALAIIALLLIPILKLRTIDQNGSLSELDVAALLGSVPLAIATVGILAAIHGQWYSVRANLDKDARLEAAKLARELDREIGVTLDDAANRYKVSREKLDYENDNQTLKIERFYSSKFVTGENDYIYSRKYYWDIYTKSNTNEVPDNPLWIYTVSQVPALTYSDSRLVAALRPANDQCNRNPEVGRTGKSCFFVMAVKPLASTLHRPMPAGFGYAVLDSRTLEVLQHSNPKRAHSQHFDNRMNRPDWLLAMRDSFDARCERQRLDSEKELVRPSQPVDLLHAGKSVRMSLVGACTPGWLVAVWYDKASAQRIVTIPGRLAASFLLLGATVIAVIALLAVLFGWMDRKRFVQIFWPRPDKMDALSDDGAPDKSQDVARSLVFSLPVVGVLFIAGAIALPQGALTLYACTIALASLASLCLIYLDCPPAVLSKIRLVWVIIAGLSALTFVILAIYRQDPIRTALAPVIIALGAIIPTFLRDAGDWLRLRMTSLKRWRAARKAKSLAGASRFVSPEASPESVMDKSYYSRAVQILSTIVIVILPVYFVYFDGVGAVQSARTNQELLAKDLAVERARASKDYRDNCLAQGTGPCPVPNTAKILRFWPETMKDSEPNEPRREPGWLTGGTATLIDRLSLASDLDVPISATSEYVAKYVAGLPKQLSGVDVQADVKRNLDREKDVRIDDFIAVPVFLALLILVGAMVYACFHVLNRGLFGLQHFEFRSLHPKMSATALVDALNKTTDMRRVLFIDFPWSEYDELIDHLNGTDTCEELNLGSLREEQEFMPNDSLARRPWIIRGFESISGDPDLRDKALRLMERLVQNSEVQIYFFSEMLPIARLKHQRERDKQELLDAGLSPRTRKSEPGRWSDLFETFVTYRYEERDSPETVLHNLIDSLSAKTRDRESAQRAIASGIGGSTAAGHHPLYARVFAKGAGGAVHSWSHARAHRGYQRLYERGTFWSYRNPLKLWDLEAGGQARIIKAELSRIPSSRIREQLVTFPNPPDVGRSAAVPPTKEQIHEYLANFLGDYYQSQWVRSSKEEHLVMHHLAHGRFVNAENFTVINNLLTRGLVRRSPDFQLMNESFAYWIRTLEHPRWFEKYRMEIAEGETWRRLRMPVVLLVLTSALVIAYLSEDMSGSLLTLIPAVAAMIPLLVGRFSQVNTVLSD